MNTYLQVWWKLNRGIILLWCVTLIMSLIDTIGSTFLIMTSFGCLVCFLISAPLVLDKYEGIE